MRLIVLITILIWLAFAPLQAFEKVGTTSFQFLKVVADARSMSMAGAYTAVVSHADAVFWNPAALTRVVGMDASFSYMDYFLDVKHFSAAAAIPLGFAGTLGFQFMLADYGSIEVTEVTQLGFRGEVYNPGLTGEIINPYAVVAGISFAKKLTDKFSFGLTGKFAREDMDYQSPYASSSDNYAIFHNAIMFDAGLLYETGFRSLRLSAVVRHFGPEVKYIDQSYPLPQLMNIGIAANLFAPDEAMFFQLPGQRLIFAFDMVQPRDYDQQYNVGLEYSFRDLLYFRGGYRINYDTEGLSLGFGLQFKNYRVDYAFNDYGDFLDSVHRFSFGIKLK
ncbi:MAG: PorV/PorQ family protein [Caldisericaceae bacterium]|nr:PorV/PorQ family protein [Caldisericaceae bacterium]